MQGRLTAPGMLEKQVRAHDRRSARRVVVDAVRGAVAAAERRRRDAARRDLLPVLRPHARRGVRARDRALLPEHRPRRSQRARPADRRLLLRQRSDRAALRHRQRDRTGVPPGGAARDPARDPRPGQRAGADLGRRSHLAGDARQVDHGSAARLAAAAAAAERAGARGDQRDRRRQGAVDARADGRAPQEPGVPVVPQGDRSARARARQLRRHRQVADQGQRRGRSMRRE